MKKNVKTIVLIAIVIISLIATAIYVTQGVSVDTYDITAGYANYYFTEQGVVGETEYFNQYSKNSGDVVNVNVKVGDTIKEGDVIAELENSNLSFEISSVQNQINGYKAQIDNIYVEDTSRKNTINSSIDDLKSQLETLEVSLQSGNVSKHEQIQIQKLLIEQNETDLQKLKTDLEKYTILFEEGIISRADYENLEKQVTSYENTLEQNKKQLNIIQSGGANDSDQYIESTKKALNVQINNLQSELNADYITPTIQYQNSLIKIAEQQLILLNEQKENLLIKSNTDGIISQLPVANTNFVTNVSPVAIIKKENSLIESHISTRDIDSIEVGSNVNIVIDKREGETTTHGKIHSIDNEAKLEISALGLEERKIKVLIEPLEQLNLVSGFDVDIEYLLYENDNTITIPKESIFKYEDGYAVYKVVGGKATVTPVTKGIELRETFVIDDGLQNGDIIVLDANDDKIKNGTKIN